MCTTPKTDLKRICVHTNHFRRSMVQFGQMFFKIKLSSQAIVAHLNPSYIIILYVIYYIIYKVSALKKNYKDANSLHETKIKTRNNIDGDCNDH